FYATLLLFVATGAAMGNWGGTILFASWIAFAVGVAYAWTFRRRGLPLASMIGLTLLSMGACVAGAEMSPSSSTSSGRSHSAPVAAPTPVPTSTVAAYRGRVAVAQPPEGAWTAQLTGGDDSEVGSVIFWV